MAIVNNYPIDSQLTDNDFLLGLDASDGYTKKYRLSDLANYIGLEASNVQDTNYYLNGISSDEQTGIITFNISDAEDQNLVLGTAAFLNAEDIALDGHTHSFSTIAADRVITANYLDVDSNGTSGQVLSSDGLGGFNWIDAGTGTGDNYYLDNITKSGNKLVFSVSDSADVEFEFGEAAFLSLAQILERVTLNVNAADLIQNLGSLAGLDKVTSNYITQDAVTTTKIQASAVTEDKLNANNSPTAGYVLTSNGGNGFTWVQNSASNYYLTNISNLNNTLTFELGGGAPSSTFPKFTFGDAAFKSVGTSLGQVADGSHSHDISDLTGVGTLAVLSSIGTSEIANNAVTLAKLSSQGSNGQFLTITNGALAWDTIATAAVDFLSLPTTPSTYTGNASKILKVNELETALEFVNFSVAADDLAATNSASPGKVLGVDSNHDLTWINVTTGGSIVIYPDDLNGITTNGLAGQGIMVNGNGTFSYFSPFDYEWSSLLNTPTTISGYGITDAMTTAHDANVITSADISNWDNAFGWGDHSTVGYLTAETDPIFAASAAYGITGIQVNNWDTAFGWGDHSTYGYLTAETDPIFTASAASGITSTNIAQWDTAHSWGNHADAGYISSETNTSLSLANNILTYTDETGVSTDFDLSLYLDDTNLARLTSGTFNAQTSIATFTRDDATTFDVDFSSLVGGINTFVSSASFDSTSGTLTIARNDSINVTANLDGRYLTSYTETSTLDDVISRNAQTTTTAVIPFYYADQNAFPSPTEFHGAMAHSHADGTMFYAHQNAWQELANADASNLTNTIGYAQTANEFKTSEAFTTDVDFSSAAVFTQTLSANLTMTFSNAGIGMTKVLLITGGNGGYTVTFPFGATKLSGDYDDTVVNFIQVTCTGSGEYYYTISQPA